MLPELDIDDYVALISRFLSIAIGRQFDALKRKEPFDLAASIGQQLRHWRADEIAWEKAGSHWAVFHRHVRRQAGPAREGESPRQATLHFSDPPR